MSNTSIPYMEATGGSYKFQLNVEFDTKIIRHLNRMYLIPLNGNKERAHRRRRRKQSEHTAYTLNKIETVRISIKRVKTLIWLCILIESIVRNMCSPDGKINFLLIQRTEKLTKLAKRNTHTTQKRSEWFFFESKLSRNARRQTNGVSANRKQRPSQRKWNNES